MAIATLLRCRYVAMATCLMVQVSYIPQFVFLLTTSQHRSVSNWACMSSRLVVLPVASAMAGTTSGTLHVASNSLCQEMHQQGQMASVDLP